MAQPSSAASAPNVQVAALQERLNEKLKRTTAFCDLPLGHEQAIRIVDTNYFECACCPAAAADAKQRQAQAGYRAWQCAQACPREGARKARRALGQGQEQGACAAKAAALRSDGWPCAGVARVWHARAAERTYAPGGRGFAVARASFEAHKRM